MHVARKSVLVEFDCLDHEQRRRLVRLLVWIFGIREVLAIEDFCDEPPSHPPKGTKGLMTLDEFGSAKRALARDEAWQSAVFIVAFLVFLLANLAVAKRVDEGNVVVKIAYPVVLVVSLIGFFVYPSKRRKWLRKRHRLTCPACGKSLIFIIPAITSSANRTLLGLRPWILMKN